MGRRASRTGAGHHSCPGLAHLALTRLDDRPARHYLQREQTSYDLARLSRNGLITRMPHRNLYVLPPDDLRFAVFYTKSHDRILRPLMACDQPQAPPLLAAALRTIDTEVSRRIAAAPLPAAA